MRIFLQRRTRHSLVSLYGIKIHRQLLSIGQNEDNRTFRVADRCIHYALLGLAFPSIEVAGTWCETEYQRGYHRLRCGNHAFRKAKEKLSLS